LVDAIADGTLAPGQRIRQEELGRMLGVSRQPISHALQLLKQQKLVEESGRRGLIVCTVDAASIRELYQVRTALDALAARLAAERVAPHVMDMAQRRAAQRALAAGLALRPDAPVLAFIQADVAFHTALYRLSGNLAIEDTVAAQWPHLKRSMGAVLNDADRRPLVWAEHAEILRLVLTGDAAGAESAARHHTDRAGVETARRIARLVAANQSPLPSGENLDAAYLAAAPAVRRRGLSVPARLLLGGGGRDPARRGGADLRHQPAGGMAREDRRAAHRLRTAFAAHTYNEAFHLLGSHPRLIRPVEQVFGEQLYMHQYKINAKAAFEGDVWQWHQDYGTWARDDGMPEPRAMNIAVFMDEVMPTNGPLMLVPRSHKHGVLSAGHDEETTSYPLWTLDQETVTRLVQEGGIVAPTGKPGAVLMFHGNLVHGSAPNITPYPRRIVYLTLCAVSNYIRKPTRPEWIAHRDFTPIEPVPDGALLDYARAYRNRAAAE
jgi:L-proline 4-hydroxylase